LIEQAGQSVSAAVNASRKILAGKEEEIEEGAIALDEAGTLSGPAIRQIISNIQNAPQFVVRIISAQGKTLQEKLVHYPYDVPASLQGEAKRLAKEEKDCEHRWRILRRDSAGTVWKCGLCRDTYNQGVGEDPPG
jgi:hypothetical protein